MLVRAAAAAILIVACASSRCCAPSGTRPKIPGCSIILSRFGTRAAENLDTDMTLQDVLGLVPMALNLDPKPDRDLRIRPHLDTTPWHRQMAATSSFRTTIT